MSPPRRLDNRMDGRQKQVSCFLLFFYLQFFSSIFSYLSQYILLDTWAPEEKATTREFQ